MPVSTPVTIAAVGDSLVFRTYHTAGKVKRLRRDPNVVALPSTFRGRARGDPVAGSPGRLPERRSVWPARRSRAAVP